MEATHMNRYLLYSILASAMIIVPAHAGMNRPYNSNNPNNFNNQNGNQNRRIHSKSTAI